MVIFRIQKGSASKTVWETLIEKIQEKFIQERGIRIFLVLSMVFIYLLPENRNWPKIYAALSYIISTKYVNIPKTIYSIISSRFITDLYERKSELRNNF